MRRLFLLFYPKINWIVKKLLKKDGISEVTYLQFIKHLVVGGSGAFLNYILFNLLFHLKFGTVVANTITNAVVIIGTLLGQKFFTYKVRDNAVFQAALFLVQSLVYYAVDTSIVYVLINLLTVSPLIAKLISIAMLTPLSFLGNKFIIFRKRDGRGS